MHPEQFATWSRCKPPERPHIWSAWAVIFDVLGLQERRCARCGKRQHRKRRAGAMMQR